MTRRFGLLMSRVLTLIKEAPTYKRRFPTEGDEEEWEFMRKCMRADNFKDVGPEDMIFLKECRREIERFIEAIGKAERSNRIRDMREAIPSSDEQP